MVMSSLSSSSNMKKAGSSNDDRNDDDDDDVARGMLRWRMRFLKLDLCTLRSIRAAVDTFDRMDLPLHVLIKNAGVMMSKWHVTEDGFEMTMAANPPK